MRQVRFDIVGGASCPTDCEEEGVGYTSISDAECACGEQGCPISSGSRVSYGIVMTVTENGGSETVKFPDISFSEKKLRDFVAMLERNGVSPVHVEEMIDDFFYSG